MSIHLTLIFYWIPHLEAADKIPLKDWALRIPKVLQFVPTWQINIACWGAHVICKTLVDGLKIPTSTILLNQGCPITIICLWVSMPALINSSYFFSTLDTILHETSWNFLYLGLQPDLLSNLLKNPWCMVSLKETTAYSLSKRSKPVI